MISILVVGNDISTPIAIKKTLFFQSVGLFIVPPFILAYLWSFKPFEHLRINRFPAVNGVLFAMIIMIAAIPAVNLIAEINHAIKFPESLSFIEKYLMKMEQKAEDITNIMLSVNTVTDLLINIGLIGIIPAVGEELIFRGTIQRLLQNKMKIHAAVWIAAFIFSSIHFQFYGFVPRLLMGALLGYLFVWTNNLWVPIMAHFTNNALAVVFYYLKNTGQTTFDMEHIGSADTYLYGIVSMVIVTVLIFFFRPGRLPAS